MSSGRHAAPARLPRGRGRHRRPSRAEVLVPTGVTSGLLVASTFGGVAAAGPAGANEGGAATSSASAGQQSSGSSGTSQASDRSDSLPKLPHLLTRGSTGRYVELVQERVGVATDGIYGPKTEAAVRKFQRDNGLTVDGIVGPETWGALGGKSGGGKSGKAEGETRPAGSGSSGSSASGLAAKVISLAADQKGDPYAYGAEGPDAFDCSGLVQYVFGKLGHDLPRTTQAQYEAVTHVSRGNLRAGDLVFLFNSGGAYHVGIYAGDGYWWVARHSGTTVTKQKAYWKSGGYDWRVGRVA